MNPLQPQQLDQDVVNLAKAIRSIETRGQKDPYTARGASKEFGAYQFTPETWDKATQKYLGQRVPLEQSDRETQNKVAYSYLKDLKDQGYNVGQIASIWNSGKPEAYQDPNYTGVNKYGVKYDVPQYARSVAEAYHSIKGGGEPTVTPTTASTVGSEQYVKEPQPSLSGNERFIDEVKRRRQEIKDIRSSDQGRFSKILQEGGQVAGMASSLAMRGVSALIPNFIERPIAQGLQDTAQVVMNTAPGQKLLEKGGEFAEKHPTAAKNIEAVGNIASIIPTGGILGGTAKAEIAALKKTASLSKKGTVGALKVTGIATPEKVAAKAYKGFEDLINSGVKTKTLYDRIITKGSDPLKILSSDSRFVPEVSEGRVIPDNAIIALQKEIEPMAKIIRGVIESDGKLIDIDIWEKQALKQVENLKLRGDEYNRVRNGIQKDFDAYRKNYADANGLVPLTLIDDVKKAKYGEINWNNPDQNSIDRAVSKSARKIIEDNITDADIRALNRELGQMFDAQEILEALGGRAVKGGKLGKHFTTTMGAIVGSSAEGAMGGLSGGIIGAFLADKLSKAMQSSYFQNPIMQKIVGELRMTRPDLFKQAEPIANRGLLQLPAPKPGSPTRSIDTPIKLPPKTASKIEAEERKRLTQRRGFIRAGAPQPFVNEGELTTKVLSKLEGKTTVSKQFISDLTNSPDLKQAERDLIRNILKEYPEGTIPVAEFGNKVKSELLPLKRVDQSKGGGVKDYENITLPDDLRGPVANYSENIYNSPIKTSAGEVHFPRGTDSYFAHTRIEDLPPAGTGKFGQQILKQGAKFPNAGGDTRRVIEIQSDLFQKGRLEGEVELPRRFQGWTAEEQAAYRAKRTPEVAKLEPYRNTWHERVIREEVKKAAQDGKTKLQFPTGETAMKIEGLGDNSTWSFVDDMKYTQKLTDADLQVGKEVMQGYQRQGGREYYTGRWIITDVLGDGKFKAVPKQHLEGALEKAGVNTADLESGLSYLEHHNDTFFDRWAETFDISGKVDTNNPIYKFYEKEVGRYLKNKYGAELVTDVQGVKWWEVPVKKEWANKPIDAFGKVMMNPLMAGAAASAGAAGLIQLNSD